MFVPACDDPVVDPVGLRGLTPWIIVRWLKESPHMGSLKGTPSQVWCEGVLLT